MKQVVVPYPPVNWVLRIFSYVKEAKVPVVRKVATVVAAVAVGVEVVVNT